MGDPSPAADRESYRYVLFGKYDVPPKGLGTVEVTCPSAIKTDAKKKKGKPAATVTRNGKEPAKVTVVVRFLSAEYDQNANIEENLYLIDPNGPNNGGPFQLTYPGLGPGAPAYVQVKKMSWPIKWSGTKGEITIEAEETDLAVGGGSGGAGAPPGGNLSQSERLALEAERATLNFQNNNDQLLLASSDPELRAAASDRIQKRLLRMDELTTKLDTSGDVIEITRMPAGGSGAPGQGSVATGSVTPTAADAKSNSPAKGASNAWTTGKNVPSGMP